MAKVIKIDEDTVFIGMDDNQIIKVPRSTLVFNPTQNEEVDVYMDGDLYLINQKINVKEGKVLVNKWAYAIISFLFGLIGGREFMVGDTPGGVKKILISIGSVLLLVIPFVGWIAFLIIWTIRAILNLVATIKILPIQEVEPGKILI